MCVMRLARLRSDAFFNTEETIFLVNEENCINESACVQETIIRHAGFQCHFQVEVPAKRMCVR
jgi:hypothetical protein